MYLSQRVSFRGGVAFGQIFQKTPGVFDSEAAEAQVVFRAFRPYITRIDTSVVCGAGSGSFQVEEFARFQRVISVDRVGMSRQFTHGRFVELDIARCR